MPLRKRARFEGAAVWEQHARAFETRVLQLAGFRGGIVPAGHTEASIVDQAWANHTRYNTEEQVKAYAKQMLEVTEQFHDAVHDEKTVLVCVQDAQNRNTRGWCRLKVGDKLQVAIDAYTKSETKSCLPIKEIQYCGVPFEDNRVYPYNTAGGLGMLDHDVIYVYHALDEQHSAVDRKLAKSFDICIAAAEGLAEASFLQCTYWDHEAFDRYAEDFCKHKGLAASKVRFMHAGHEIAHNTGATLRALTRFDSSAYIQKPGPLMIYVLPTPEFESDTEQCFVPGGGADEQADAARAAGRRARPGSSAQSLR